MKLRGMFFFMSFDYHPLLDIHKSCLSLRLNLDRGLDIKISLEDVGPPYDLSKALWELVGLANLPNIHVDSLVNDLPDVYHGQNYCKCPCLIRFSIFLLRSW